MLQTPNPVLRLPEALRKNLKAASYKRPVLELLRNRKLHTVCEEARCINIGDCFSRKTATFMILGDRCTRRCHFCSVQTKRPKALDPLEPENVAQAAFAMGLEHVVITSVDRDDLPDLGANHFVLVIQAIKKQMPKAVVEILTPDFKGRRNLIEMVAHCGVDVFGHNIETIPRIYRLIRPQSRFETSGEVLKTVALQNGPRVKSGMMVGLGETDFEVLENLKVLRSLGASIVTIGQYLRPSLRHWPVDRYVSEESYQLYREEGQKLGFDHVFAGPFVRSSYHAKEALSEAVSGATGCNAF